MSKKNSRKSIIAFIGPGKTGTSSIFEAVKNFKNLELISADHKETYIHSHEDIRKGVYGNLIWKNNLIEIFKKQFIKKQRNKLDKKIVILEPSYADSEKALKYCSLNCETIVITIRPVLKRICSHLIMDSRLGILNFRNLCRNNFYSERIYYYLFLSNYNLLNEKLKSMGTDMNKVFFLDLNQRKLYKNNDSNKNEDIIREISIVTLNHSSNLARLPKNFFIELIYQNNIIRRISRLKFLNKLKKLFNKKYFDDISIERRKNIENLIYKNYKSSIDAIEFQNNSLLSTKVLVQIK